MYVPLKGHTTGVRGFTPPKIPLCPFFAKNRTVYVYDKRTGTVRCTFIINKRTGQRTLYVYKRTGHRALYVYNKRTGHTVRFK